MPERAVMTWTDSMRVKPIRQGHAGPAMARYRGAAESSGSVLAFTDDDCRPAPDWLRRFEARFAAKPGCVIAAEP